MGSDLAELGYRDSSRVELVRRVYCRERADLTRTSAWDTGEYRAVRRPTV